MRPKILKRTENKKLRIWKFDGTRRAIQTVQNHMEQLRGYFICSGFVLVIEQPPDCLNPILISFKMGFTGDERFFLVYPGEYIVFDEENGFLECATEQYLKLEGWL